MNGGNPDSTNLHSGRAATSSLPDPGLPYPTREGQPAHLSRRGESPSSMECAYSTDNPDDSQGDLKCFAPPALSEEGRLGPALLDVGYQPDNVPDNRWSILNDAGEGCRLPGLVGAAQYLQGQIAETQRLYSEAIATALRNWDLSSDHAAILSGWLDRIRVCGATVWLKECANDHTRAIAECCGVPLCPRYQRKRSQRWIRRASALIALLHRESKVPKLLTVTLRRNGADWKSQIDSMVKLRAALMRLLRRCYGLEAAFAAIEISHGGHVHIHAVIWSDYVPRALLQTWLRSRDCTVPGCPHPADDRCQRCRQEQVACKHLDGKRERCNGSYMIDIRQCHSPIEALKYATAPIVCEAAPRGSKRFSPEQLEMALQTIRLYLALYRRHRVETYGAAKVTIQGEGSDDEDADIDRCHCGSPLHMAAVGIRVFGGTGYRWRRARSTDSVQFIWSKFCHPFGVTPRSTASTGVGS
jgi:hypothetical protein